MTQYKKDAGVPQTQLAFLDESKDAFFHKSMAEALETSASEGDVIPLVIQRNVPNRILRLLWPEKYEEFLNSPCRLAFAAAETGWKGRIANIQSRITQVTGERLPSHKASIHSLSSPASYAITLDKSYVIDADFVLVLLRHTDSELALCLFPSRHPSLVYEARREPGLLLPRSDGSLVRHSFLHASLELSGSEAKDKVLFLKEGAYSRIALGIPALEISSMALLSLALLRSHKVRIPQEMDSLIPLILKARANEGSLRRALVLSRKLLRYFYHALSKHRLRVHPFWMELQKLGGLD